jgi:plasmid stability protein
MAVLKLKISDDFLVQRVRNSAARRNVSVEEEIVDTLRARFVAEREDILRRADEVAAMTPVDVNQTDSTVMVREDRDR